jgi:hypothetical protein
MSMKNPVLLGLLWISLVHPASSQDSTTLSASKVLRHSKPDFNRSIYYRNKLEFSLETGWLPNNIPFVFDFIVNSPYTQGPLHYTLAPNIASLRWHIDNI